MTTICLLLGVAWFAAGKTDSASSASAEKGMTSLANPSVKFTVVREGFVELSRGGVTAVITDNQAQNSGPAKGHKAGYNGVAVLRRTSGKPSGETAPRDSDNLFVPGVAGLNLEHIHDGTSRVNRERYEPRVAPMELRRIDQFTVELYQAPTPHWKLESCGRYHLLADGTIEYTFECVPRADTFRQGWMGFFWASYIHRPRDKAIHFWGSHVEHPRSAVQWVRAETPKHGVDATHPPRGPLLDLKFSPDFSISLANHRSKYVHAAPWYYGVRGEYAFVQIFRGGDGIWFAQSPSGGGGGNPAWDFQWFVPRVRVNQLARLTMRAALVPFTTRERLEKDIRPHVDALNPPQTP